MKKYIIILSISLLALTGCIQTLDSNGNPITPTATPLEVSKDLQIVDIKVGTGAEAKVGNKVKVHYDGTFADGKKFDSSRDRNQPFEFTIGAQMVIKGWDQGIQGMKVGGIRKLVVPPSLGYGTEDYGSIPGNSTLNFVVELLEVN